MKHLIIATIAVFGLFSSANAQSILSLEQQQKVIENVNQFVSDINLSERDKPQFRMIVEDFFIGLSAVGSTYYSKDTKKKIVQELIKGRDQRFKQLLNKEQFKMYIEKTKQTREDIKKYMNL